MFAALFVFMLMTTYALSATELPSYIHVCGRKNLNYDQCIMDNLYSMKNKICTGMPEFNVHPNEPIIIDKIIIYDTNNLKLYLRDFKLRGICDYVVNSVHTNLDRLHIDFDITFVHLIIDTIYDFDIHILVPLANKGLTSIIADNIPMKVSMDLKVATRNDEKQIYAWKVNTNVNITSFKYKFDDSEKELTQLHQVLSNVIDSNTEDVIASVEPVIEEKVSQIIMSIFNNVSRSNYEKLFPEEA